MGHTTKDVRIKKMNTTLMARKRRIEHSLECHKIQFDVCVTFAGLAYFVAFITCCTARMDHSFVDQAHSDAFAFVEGVLDKKL